MAAKRTHDEDETITSEEFPCTVTLVRGESYNYKGRKYERRVPRAVTKEIAEYLADQVVTRRDRDGESMEKPVFKVTGLDDDDAGDPDDVTPTRSLARKKPARRKV